MSSSPVLKTALLRLGGLLGQHAARTGVGVGAAAPSAFAAPLFCLDQRRWMAVPKRKVSPSRRGIRNGPKLPRRVAAIARCSSCARIMPLWAAAPPADCADAACPSKVGGGGGMVATTAAIAATGGGGPAAA